jgi:transcriptional regulator of acetoin/glycerol metabolism
MGVPAVTVRSNRRHARASLRGFAAALDQDPRGLALSRAYAEMRAGNPEPAGARPIIRQSWARSAQYLVTPERGPRLAPLSADELALRRGLSPLRTCHAIWERQASATGLMISATDAGGRVLWRAGDRDDLRRGDHDGHGDGACLAEHAAGTCGVSVALAASCPVVVCGAEHYCPAQHDLVCAGAPVRHPRDGRLLGVLCISAPWPAAHSDMLKIIDQAARQVQQQIASQSRHATPASGPDPAAPANRPG